MNRSPWTKDNGWASIASVPGLTLQQRKFKLQANKVPKLSWPNACLSYYSLKRHQHQYTYIYNTYSLGSRSPATFCCYEYKTGNWQVCVLGWDLNYVWYDTIYVCVCMWLWYHDLWCLVFSARVIILKRGGAHVFIMTPNRIVLPNIFTHMGSMLCPSSYNSYHSWSHPYVNFQNQHNFGNIQYIQSFVCMYSITLYWYLRTIFMIYA